MPLARRIALVLAPLGSAALLAAAQVPRVDARRAGPRPPLNVLMILSDQHNARMLGCTGNGHGGASRSMTPSLDRLAGDGVLFRHTDCPTPQCAPTRFSLLTGRWPHASGLRVNKVWEPIGQWTLPRAARDAGYATATIGKHHFYWLDQIERSEDHGFEHVVDFDDYADHCRQANVPVYGQPGNFHGMPGLPESLAGHVGYSFNPNEYHPSGYYADRAIEFLEESACDERPFVCWLSFIGPHTPLFPSGPADPNDFAHWFHPFDALDLPPNLDKTATTTRLANLQATYASVTDDQWRELLSYYYGLIAQIDYNIGRVLASLDRLGLSDDTLVVFTSDHGEMAAEMGCWTKGTGMYDAIQRVPLILRLPAVLPDGVVRAEPASSLDLVPTMIELTGLPIEEFERARFDGRSLVDVARGRTPDDWRRAVFSEFGGIESGGLGRIRMARTARYKYSLDERSGVVQEEFYDLARDPFELENLITLPHPAVQAEIDGHRALLAEWWNDAREHAPPYDDSGSEVAPPCPARDPWPADDASGVACDTKLRWLPSTAAQRQTVWMGTALGHLFPIAELGPMVAELTLDPLRPGQDYYWRVDQANANGETLTYTWHFRTDPAPFFAPHLASDPSPADGTRELDLSPRLRWTPGKGAAAQRLVVLADGREQRVFPLDAAASTWRLHALEAGRRHAWRVDSLHPAGATLGPEWTFETSPDELPGSALALVPTHLDESARLTPGVGLRWIASEGAKRYRLHFGREHPLPLVRETTERHFDPGPLPPATTYYWRVDAINEHGTRRGHFWRFTTAR